MRVNRKLILAAGALALASGLGGCIGYDGDFDRGYQIDEQALAKVQVGKTDKREALSLMGTPSTTSTVGGDAWYYIGQKMHRALAFMPAQTADQNVLAIYFDKGGKVARIANYGMKDGKVFDFVSRTTPTAGSDVNFVKAMFDSIMNAHFALPF